MRTGPRILFFSGGDALRSLCGPLQGYTERSVHLVTTFDSGGSSATLRAAIGMPAVGDLRNRLVALSRRSSPRFLGLRRFISHRLAASDGAAARDELDAVLLGRHPCCDAVTPDLRETVLERIGELLPLFPISFDARNASLGNLLLASTYLANGRRLQVAVDDVSRMLDTRGVVLPISEDDFQLCGRLADGRRVLGQHLLTGKEVPPLDQKILDLWLADSRGSMERRHTRVSDVVLRHIIEADLICYPVGSFFTSVVANLLPLGVGTAIRQARCPKVYVPNMQCDPEQHGMSVAESVATLTRFVCSEGGSAMTRGVVDYVLLDPNFGLYGMPVNVGEIERLGSKVVALDLGAHGTGLIQPNRLCEGLLSLL